MAPQVHENDVEDPFEYDGFSALTLTAPVPTPPPFPTEDYAAFFKEWQATLQSYMDDTLPGLLNVSTDTLSTFQSSVRAVVAARTVQQDAERLLDELQKAHAADNVIADAQKNVQDAQTAVQTATSTCRSLAHTSIFQHLDNSFLSSIAAPWDDTYFLLYIILQQGGTRWAGWCQSLSIVEAQKFMSEWVLPPITPLARSMMEAGGPAAGQFLRAHQIYHLGAMHAANVRMPAMNAAAVDYQDVTERLRLAVALEHAEPIASFGTANHFIDPVKRYLHYLRAFTAGDLDAHVSQFNVWELRHVVDADASDEELTWGRQSLRAYRPDLVLLQDPPSWNYCMIVKTDVAYATPDWYKSPRSYDQILSGGGKCGPRAWYGRFICKAFGIPTWGVRQPGHAAMTRWTTKGWDVCLGGGLWKSWWNDQGGLDFLLETQARQICASETIFMQKVLRLVWLAKYYFKENSTEVRRNGQYDPNNLWSTLEMIQRQRLAEEPLTNIKLPPVVGGNNKNEGIRVQQQINASKEEVSLNQAGVIVIPATSCSNPSNKKIQFMPCFLGGQQLFVKEDAELEYQVAPSLWNRTDVVASASYNLSCRVATAHRSEQPIQLTIGSNSYTILLPYTMALWGSTEPIQIEVDFSSSSPVVLRIKRTQQNFGFAFKDIQLNPISAI